jgi:hypothetical protein
MKALIFLRRYLTELCMRYFHKKPHKYRRHEDLQAICVDVID